MVIPSMVSCDFGNKDEDERISSELEDSSKDDDSGNRDDDERTSSELEDISEDDSGGRDEDERISSELDDSSADEGVGATGNGSLSESPEQPTRTDNAAVRKHATTSLLDSAQTNALLWRVPFITHTNI
jgi:Nucleosome binding factor SPN, SPT16 subunit